MANSYFYGSTSGLKAEIERHRTEEAELRQKIAELEAEEPSKTRDRSLQAYHYFLQALLDSKAQTTNKIGKKK
jgi:hypothetical protein